MDEDQRRTITEQIATSLPLPAEFAEEFAAFTAETVMGGVWARTEQLSARERSLITIAALTALDRPHELEIHMGFGLDNGLTQREIFEVVMHMAVYGGWPVAVEGMRTAKKVFEARDAG